MIVAVLIAVYLVATLTAAIKSEEAFLRRTFGDQYDLYESGVAAKRRERSAASRAAVQPRAGDRQPRVLARSPASAIAILLLVWKATYNGLFWRAAGAR